MDYKSTVTGIGPLVNEFIEQEMLIVFNENAPEALAEMAVLHTITPMDQEVKPEDVVILGDKSYVVTAVGAEANHTLSTLGHCTFCFRATKEAELPGHIELEGDGMPDIKIGDPFEILFT